jgi:5-methylcytosine-specific restriction protein A
MPLAPLRACPVPGCAVLVRRGRCRLHAVAKEHARPNRDVRQWYCTPLWFQVRQQVLVDAAYTCAQCGVIQANLAVDHIEKHHGNLDVFWNRANLQALCPTCHGRKTARGA